MRVRLPSLVVVALLLLSHAGCTAGPGTGRVDAGGALERGEDRASELIELARGASFVDGPEALELLYVERLRLGLGSPFRLIDQVLIDERLEPERRRRLAEALLALTWSARGYVIDPAGITGPRGRFEPHVEAAHARLVSAAVSEAADPRVGEEAVRLAYVLAQAEGLGDPILLRAVAHAAALIRDRELARADARALVAEAYATQRDPLDLITQWRAERRFRVEAPQLDPLPAVQEGNAIELALRLSESIHAIAASDADDASYRRVSPASLLSPATASALARELERMPAQAPVAVAVGLAARMFASSYGIDADSLAGEMRMRMPDEERFAVQYALLLQQQPELRPMLSRAALAAASSLRAYSQEAAWRPGMNAPSTRELIAQFGLAEIVFADDITASWRPYYRRMIHSALLDLQRVLPALDVTGLRIVIGRVPEGGALALHSPGGRTIFLPPTTGAGTIAHEIAHDLDWQVARKRYNVRGDYGSDIASRGARRDRLAATYMGLTGAALVDNVGTTIDRPHHTRPAEIFARSVDWLVASSLARDGRMNGYLSSIQDELLTGYGTAVPPDADGRVPSALIEILDVVAPMRTEHRAWYLEAYGLGHELSALDLLRVVADSPFDEADLAAFSTTDSADATGGSRAVLTRSLARLSEARAGAVSIGVCRVVSSNLEPRGTGARTQLIDAATEARARGLAREVARRVIGPDGEQALAERFGQGPWSTPVAESDAGLIRALVDAVADATRREEELERRSWFGPIVGPLCG